MSPLRGKKILLGITGSISAYKAPLFVRLLKKSGAEVQVVVTPSALDFVSPLVLATLSERPVFHAFVDGSQGHQWNNHVELGCWADAIVVAPASSVTLAKGATGLCDNLLTAVILSAKCPVIWAPAMDLDMYAFGATQNNFATLESFGHHIIPADSGPLASGLEGQGRLPEPESLFSYVEHFFGEKGSMVGERVLITAGPTQEPLDAVRFLSNASSGKMGWALARSAALRGAQVDVVLGPVSDFPFIPGVQVHSVVTAEEMFHKTLSLFPTSTCSVFTAAVADYAVATPEKGKRKKSDEPWNLSLKPTLDILKACGQSKQKHQKVIGFALETDNGLANAQEKAVKKGADVVCFNPANEEGLGFGSTHNRVVMVNASGIIKEFPAQSKQDLAEALWDTIEALSVVK